MGFPGRRRRFQRGDLLAGRFQRSLFLRRQSPLRLFDGLQGRDLGFRGVRLALGQLRRRPGGGGALLGQLDRQPIHGIGVLFRLRRFQQGVRFGFLRVADGFEVLGAVLDRHGQLVHSGRLLIVLAD